MEDYSRVTLAVLVALALGVAGCRGRLAPPLPAGSEGVPPGESMVRGVEDPLVVKRCTKPSPSFMWIDAVEVKPRKVQKGSRINNRLTYTFCPQAPANMAEGMLTTNVSQAGRKVLSESIGGYRLKPGQWTVDTVIVIPPDAIAGAYLLDISFAGDGGSLSRAAKFAVY